ncbi:ExbD/TolR family protein [Thermosulfurimonas dismutans]|uniref:Biopolymer transport protein ExbD/TolR n=1 Tax=Thermosulfurimonas dismutans TaxID=999894 RepID=A0A179D5Z9_9BACT|nr:biopolymer transporter ExbD [Thermosulfurimonas dismutans]OAQ21477.1 Biopolymer transport protein ExbD/TolR [Thermosulfurimonas dismutans]
MKSGKKGLMAEINVTPLVDVMLVLLIIFMITAPLLTTGIQVDLPETRAGELKKSEKPFVITITKEGKIIVGQQSLSLDRLSRWLAEAKRVGIVKDVQIQADKQVPYGLIAKVLGELEAAGITEIGLMTKPVSGNEKL